MKHLMIALTLALSAPIAHADVTLINVFEVPEGKRDDAIRQWERARDFLSTQDGYISTALHGSVTPDARFELINIAQWESPEQFQAAISAMRASGLFPPLKGLGVNAALYEVIRSDCGALGGAGC